MAYCKIINTAVRQNQEEKNKKRKQNTSKEREQKHSP